MTDAIDKQIDGKLVSVRVEPKVDERAAAAAGKKARETVEKQTREVKVEPKVDQRAAEAAGKTTGDSVAKGASGSLGGVGEALTGALINAGSGAGTKLGEILADTIPTNMTGVAQRIGDVLYNTLPAIGASAGALAGGAIGKAVTDAISGERFQNAGQAIKRGLVSAVDKANTGVDVGIKVGNSLAGGLTNASGAIDGAAAKLTGTIGGIGDAVTTTMGLLGVDDAWAAPGLDVLNTALGTATPLLEGMSAASTLASAGAQAISVATGAASKAQVLWNAALVANPIGLIVTAIGAVVAGLVLFFTKTELGRKIWAEFSEFLSAAWEKVQVAFRVAWSFISVVFDAMITKVGEVWSGVRDRFTAVVDFVRGLPSAITNAAKGMWEGLKSGLVAVLNWIADKWNGFAESLSIDLPGKAFDVTIPKLPKFSGGGYTGNAPIDEIAGVVHGGEFVVKAGSQKRIENAYPGLLDYLNNNGKLPGLLPGYEGGGLVAGTDELRKIISERFGISNIGGYRGEDGFGEHSTGRALDVMVGNNKAKGDAIRDFALSNAAAMDLKWVIWRRHLYYAGGGGYDMEDRGSPTQNHMDHVHIFSGPAITNGLLGPLKSKEAERDAAAPAPAGGTPAESDVAPAAASAGASVPSSISGLSSFGLTGLGAGVGTTSSGSDLSLFGDAAGAAVSGQVSSALGVLGVGDSPGWLKGIGTLIGGISVSGKDGKKIFGGGAAGGALSGAGNLFGGSQQSVAPIAAAPATVRQPAAVGAVHGSTGGQRPGPAGATYNIRTATVEDAFLAAQRREDELNAAQLSRFG
ncbi:MAG: phage tail protein [Actinomycetota bacterium]|nr:phage tail protein [Actinomycetota bacterium]